MRIRFRFRAIPLVATLLLVALGVSLGQWQDRRAAYKSALQATLDARAGDAPVHLGAQPLAADAAEYRRVSATGQFVKDWPLYLDNRPYKSRAGLYVLMPFRLEGSSMHVLVARGWLARDMAARERIAAYATAQGTVTIEGVAKASVGRVMQLGEPAQVKPGAIVQNIDAARFAEASGLLVQPFIVEQAGGAPEDGLLRDWPAPSLGVEKHQGYAFQWYALAVMAFLFFVITGFRSGTRQS